MKEDTVVVAGQEDAAQASSTRQRSKKPTQRKIGGSQRHSAKWLARIFRAALVLTALQLPYQLLNYHKRATFQSGAEAVYKQQLLRQVLYVERSRKLQLAVASLAVVGTALVIFAANYLHGTDPTTREVPPDVHNMTARKVEENLPGTKHGTPQNLPADSQKLVPETTVAPGEPSSTMEQQLELSKEPDLKEEIGADLVLPVLEDLKKAIDDEENLSVRLFHAINKAEAEQFPQNFIWELKTARMRLEERLYHGDLLLHAASRIEEAKEPYTYEFFKDVSTKTSELVAERRYISYLLDEILAE